MDFSKGDFAETKLGLIYGITTVGSVPCDLLFLFKIYCCLTMVNLVASELPKDYIREVFSQFIYYLQSF